MMGRLLWFPSDRWNKLFMKHFMLNLYESCVIFIIFWMEDVIIWLEKFWLDKDLFEAFGCLIIIMIFYFSKNRQLTEWWFEIGYICLQEISLLILISSIHSVWTKLNFSEFIICSFILLPCSSHLFLSEPALDWLLPYVVGLLRTMFLWEKKIVETCKELF